MLFGKSNQNDPQDHLKKKLVVKTNRCPQNHPCPSVRVCPVGALKQQGYHAPSVDLNACIRCGKCVRSCPMGALVLE